MQALLTERLPHLAALRRRDRRRAAAAGRARRADLGEGRRPQHRHRRHDARSAPIPASSRAYYTGSFWLGFLAGGLGGMAVALFMVLLLHPPRPEPDRHRHRAHPRRRGADGAAALLPVQPHLSAPLGRRRWSHCRCWTRFPCWARRCSATISSSIWRSLLVIGLGWLFRRTYIGLNLEAAGDKPAALDAAGVDVIRTRSLAVLATGFLAGVGGAYMANVGRRALRALHDRRRGLHRHRARHAGPRPPGLGAARRRSLRRQPGADHGAAGGRHQHPDRRGADAALRHGHAGSGNLRPPQRAAAGARPALCARRRG